MNCDKLYFRHSIRNEVFIPEKPVENNRPIVLWVDKIKSYKWYDEDKPSPDKKAWKEYRKKVRELTELVSHLIPGIELRSFKTHHIDHKISIWYGFKHKIPADTIADLSNLRMLSSRENMIKGRRCVFI